MPKIATNRKLQTLPARNLIFFPGFSKTHLLFPFYFYSPVFSKRPPRVGKRRGFTCRFCRNHFRDTWIFSIPTSFKISFFFPGKSINITPKSMVKSPWPGRNKRAVPTRKTSAPEDSSLPISPIGPP